MVMHGALPGDLQIIGIICYSSKQFKKLDLERTIHTHTLRLQEFKLEIPE